MVEVVRADSGEPLERVIELSQEYAAWVVAEAKRRYPGLDADAFASERDYDDVRKKYPGEHVPPHGCVLLASDRGVACGCVAVGRLTKTICEMRTLYVRPSFRGSGVGRRLAEASIEEARSLGYRRMRLDTLAFLGSAQRLYLSLGFRRAKPYHAVPPALKNRIRFLELDLEQGVSPRISEGVSRRGRTA